MIFPSETLNLHCYLLGDRMEMEGQVLRIEETGHAFADLNEERSTSEFVKVHKNRKAKKRQGKSTWDPKTSVKWVRASFQINEIIDDGSHEEEGESEEDLREEPIESHN